MKKNVLYLTTLMSKDDFKCWGYYHIAKNCVQNMPKCAGNHKTADCKQRKDV